MDNVLVDFKTGIARLTEEEKIKYEGRYYETPDIFSKMLPMEGAVESFKKLSEKYDTYILSTAPEFPIDSFSLGKVRNSCRLGKQIPTNFLLPPKKILLLPEGGESDAIGIVCIK